MSMRTIEERLRGADPAQRFELDVATDASARSLRDAIIAVDEPGAGSPFDTVEFVLGASGRSVRRGRAIVVAVARHSSDDTPNVATAGSTAGSTEPSTATSATPSTVVPPTAAEPSITIPVPTTAGAPNPAVTVPVAPANEPCRGAGAPYDAWGLRAYLVQQVPDGFGGVYGGSAGTLVVNVIAGREAAVADAKAEFDARSCTASPATDYETVRNTVVRMEVLKQRMAFAAAQLEAEGVDVNSYGVDDAANRLRVGLANVTGDNEQAVLDALSATRDEVVFEQQDVISPAI
jgi:hypothetical protein